MYCVTLERGKSVKGKGGVERGNFNGKGRWPEWVVGTRGVMLSVLVLEDVDVESVCLCL